MHHLISAGLALSLGYASGISTLAGCGGAPPPPNTPLPERVVDNLTECGKQGPRALAPVEHTFEFDVVVADDGHVEEVQLRSSTLHRDDVEACMTHALYGLSAPADALSLRHRGPAGQAVAPESHALLGQDGAIELLALLGISVATIGVGYAAYTVYVHYFVAHHKRHRPHAAQPQAEEPPASDKDPTPAPQGDPKTTGPTTPVPPDPPGPPKPRPRCDEAYPEVVNCYYIQQARYPSRGAALEALIKSLPVDRQRRPFTTHRTEVAKKLNGVDHTTYKSADGRTKITIGCYEQCCKNTEDGPELVPGMQCYEHNTEYLR